MKIRTKSIFTLSVLLASLNTFNASADDRSAVAATDQILFAAGIGANPITTNPVTINTATWGDALTSTYSSSGLGSKALIANISAVTAILTGDLRASTDGTLFLNWGGVQARVLVDCALPACDPTSDTVPAANIASPGVITLDQVAHFFADSGAATAADYTAALDLTAGARSFNFFFENVGKKSSHTVKFQVKFNAGGIALGDPNSVITGGVAAVAKRTMILQSMSLKNDSKK